MERRGRPGEIAPDPAGGPARNAAVDARAAAVLVAQALRGARAEAVGGNRTVTVLFDAAASRFGVAGDRTVVLPRNVAFSLLPSAPPATRNAITFAPDGSSTGGAVELSTRGRRFGVTVNWLTGRVSVTEAPPAS